MAPIRSSTLNASSDLQIRLLTGSIPLDLEFGKIRLGEEV